MIELATGPRHGGLSKKVVLQRIQSRAVELRDADPVAEVPRAFESDVGKSCHKTSSSVVPRVTSFLDALSCYSPLLLPYISL